jgi:hypothetical protein
VARRRTRTRTTQHLLAGAMALALALPLTQVLVPSGASAVDPASTGAGAKGEPLKPNLRAIRARDLYISRTGGKRKLRFEAGIANVGDGPVEVRPNQARDCPEGKHHATQVMYRDANGNGRYNPKFETDVARRSAGCMVFHQYHDHWHFEAASRYTLYRADRPKLSKVAQRKMSFCLRDSRRVPTAMGTFNYAERYGACSRHSPQGISIGWVDVYQSYLAGQAIALPPRMGDGLYCLQITVDPQNQLVETNDGDNSSLRAFYMRGDRVNMRDSAAKCRQAG